MFQAMDKARLQVIGFTVDVHLINSWDQLFKENT